MISADYVPHPVVVVNVWQRERVVVHRHMVVEVVPVVRIQSKVVAYFLLTLSDELRLCFIACSRETKQIRFLFRHYDVLYGFWNSVLHHNFDWLW